tara:strand:+ start:2643 stop:2753 length:111 start_codon:yes stop_codon:yes gene_type:complete
LQSGEADGGGVGPVTVAILMRNAMVAHKRQINAGWL